MSSEEIICKYLEEGLVALLPVYRGGVEGTDIFTLVRTYQLYHSLTWTIELLARYFCLDLGALRRRSGRLLGLSHHIPLPVSPELVLLPVKVRQGEKLGERTCGYVNMLQLEQVDGGTGRGGETGTAGDKSDSPARHGGDRENSRCRVNCGGNVFIHCRNTAVTIKDKLRQGKLLQDKLGERQRFLYTAEQKFTGLSGPVLRELLPSCDCLLRSIFLMLLERASCSEER